MNSLKSKMLGLLLAVVVVCFNNPAQAFAADGNGAVSYQGLYNVETSVQMRAPNITSASLGVTPRSNEILVEVYTGCNFVAKEIGTRNVYVQEKVWYGWKTIAQASNSEKNATSCAFSAHCTNATKGETYRVICTHYAIESNGTEHKIDNESETFVYN